MLIPTTPASAAGQAASGVVIDSTSLTNGSVIGGRTPIPFPTADELRAQQASQLNQQKTPAVRLPIEAMLQGGVVDSTLSDRGAELVAVAAKAMGLDAGEAQAAASLPPVGDDLPEQKAVQTPAPALSGGNPELLLQDQSRELSRALSQTPGARLHATEAAAAIGREAAARVAQQEAEAHSNNLQSPQALQEQANQQARAQLDAVATAGSPEQKAKPTRRSPMQMVQRLRVMELVRASPADVPDAELATAISVAIDRAVGSATIADYRKQLGMASVKMPSKAELRAKLVAMQKQLDAIAQPTLQGVPAKT